VNPPLLTETPVWSNFEGRILGVLELALSLIKEVDETTSETELNRHLADKLSEANFKLRSSGTGGLDFLPAYDGLQYPDEDSPPEAVNEKRPDFTWSWQSDSDATYSEATREYVVECKRLGDAAGDTFSNRYVDNGIARFVSESHRYGHRGDSGAMIGYVQVPGKTAILTAVQARANTQSLGDLVEDGQLEQKLARLNQHLTRNFGKSPFKLVHFWIDVVPSPTATT